MTLQVLSIIEGTIVDGPGLRTSVYLAGCRHQCPGCHNPESWSFDAGVPMSVDDLVERIRQADMNVTLSGGDPLYQIDGVVELCRRIHELGKSVWVYTGFTLEEIEADESLARVLLCADVLVEGPFVMALRDTSLRFRGSKNQRIINLSEGR